MSLIKEVALQRSCDNSLSYTLLRFRHKEVACSGSSLLVSIFHQYSPGALLNARGLTVLYIHGIVDLLYSYLGDVGNDDVINRGLQAVISSTWR